LSPKPVQDGPGILVEVDLARRVSRFTSPGTLRAALVELAGEGGYIPSYADMRARGAHDLAGMSSFFVLCMCSSVRTASARSWARLNGHQICAGKTVLKCDGVLFYNLKGRARTKQVFPDLTLVLGRGGAVLGLLSFFENGHQICSRKTI
jgi:hypothetical protein